MQRRKLVSIIGGGEKTAKKGDLELAFETGRILVKNGYRIVTGGYKGVMEAACKGARSAKNYREGDTIAIICNYEKNMANEYSDIVIASGIGYARNQIITASGDYIVAIGGGAGTLSELAFAWQFNKIIFAYNIEGWSGNLAGKSIDAKRTDSIIMIETPQQLIKELSKR